MHAAGAGAPTSTRPPVHIVPVPRDGSGEGLILGLLRVAAPLRGASDDPQRFADARAEVLRWLTATLQPRLAQDEDLLTAAYQAARTRLTGALLHIQLTAIAGRIAEAREARTAGEAIAAIRALHALLAVYLESARLAREDLAGPAPDRVATS